VDICLLDLSATRCSWLCWCTPVSGVSDIVESVAKRWPPSSRREAARAVEDIASPDGDHLTVAAALGRERRRGQTRYLLRVSARTSNVASVTRAGGQRGRCLESSVVAPFLEKLLPAGTRRRRRQVRFCAEFAFDLAKRRPVFELPVEVVSPDDKQHKLRGARLEGLEFSFLGSGVPVEGLRIRVDASEQRVHVRIEGRGMLTLGHDPMRVVHDRAERLALSFTEEVASA